MTSEPKQIRIKTADEFALAVTVFPGEDNDGAKRCAIMSSAMGVMGNHRTLNPGRC